MAKSLDKIKHADKVMALLSAPKMFTDLRESGLDQKTLQNVLAQLVKNGYVSKDDRGCYVRCSS